MTRQLSSIRRTGDTIILNGFIGHTPTTVDCTNDTFEILIGRHLSYDINTRTQNFWQAAETVFNELLDERHT